MEFDRASSDEFSEYEDEDDNSVDSKDSAPMPAGWPSFTTSPVLNLREHLEEHSPQKDSSTATAAATATESSTADANESELRTAFRKARLKNGNWAALAKVSKQLAKVRERSDTLTNIAKMEFEQIFGDPAYLEEQRRKLREELEAKRLAALEAQAEFEKEEKQRQLEAMEQQKIETEIDMQAMDDMALNAALAQKQASINAKRMKPCANWKDALKMVNGGPSKADLRRAAERKRAKEREAAEKEQARLEMERQRLEELAELEEREREKEENRRRAEKNEQMLAKMRQEEEARRVRLERRRTQDKEEKASLEEQIGRANEFKKEFEAWQAEHEAFLAAGLANEKQKKAEEEEEAMPEEEDNMAEQGSIIDSEDDQEPSSDESTDADELEFPNADKRDPSADSADEDPLYAEDPDEGPVTSPPEKPGIKPRHKQSQRRERRESLKNIRAGMGDDSKHPGGLGGNRDAEAAPCHGGPAWKSNGAYDPSLRRYTSGLGGSEVPERKRRGSFSKSESSKSGWTSDRRVTFDGGVMKHDNRVNEETWKPPGRGDSWQRMAGSNAPGPEPFRPAPRTADRGAVWRGGGVPKPSANSTWNDVLHDAFATESSSRHPTSRRHVTFDGDVAPRRDNCTFPRVDSHRRVTDGTRKVTIDSPVPPPKGDQMAYTGIPSMQVIATRREQVENYHRALNGSTVPRSRTPKPEPKSQALDDNAMAPRAHRCGVPKLSLKEYLQGRQGDCSNTLPKIQSPTASPSGARPFKIFAPEDEEDESISGHSSPGWSAQAKRTSIPRSESTPKERPFNFQDIGPRDWDQTMGWSPWNTTPNAQQFRPHSQGSVSSRRYTMDGPPLRSGGFTDRRSSKDRCAEDGWSPIPLTSRSLAPPPSRSGSVSWVLEDVPTLPATPSPLSTSTISPKPPSSGEKSSGGRRSIESKRLHWQEDVSSRRHTMDVA